MGFFSDAFQYSEEPRTATGRIGKNLRRAWLLALGRTGLLPLAPTQSPARAPWSDGLKQAVLASAARERPDVGMGGQWIHERMRLIAEESVANHPGDLVEIGCDRGESSRFLAEIARRHGRRLIAIDPWFATPERPEGVSFACFLDNIREHRDIVDIVRESSLADATKTMVRRRELSFAYVDGLHTYYAALSDIRMVRHCRGVIAVDDVSYGFQIMLALRRGARLLQRSAIYAPPCKEAYLAPSSTL
jgi:predicted O-methyltransferase YrrM